MNKKDLKLVAIIGGLVGLLAQPVLANVIDKVQGPLGEIGLSVPDIALRIGLFLFFVILAPIALWVAYKVSKIVAVVYQFAKFGAVGSLNSFVDLGFFNLLTLIFTLPAQGSFGYAGFKALSFLAATTNSYFWNRKWTFESKTEANAGEAAKFYTIAIMSGLLNVGVASLVNVAQPASMDAEVWGNIVAPICGILSSFIFNFLGYKFIVFKKPALAV